MYTDCRMPWCDSPAQNEPPFGACTLCEACRDLLSPVSIKSNTDEHGSFPKLAAKIFNRARERAKLKSREFNLTVEDIYEAWPADNKCPILKEPMKIGEPRWSSPSIDRIDSSKGYTPDNIQIICTLANRMKNDATLEQLRRFSKYYADLH